MCSDSQLLTMVRLEKMRSDRIKRLFAQIIMRNINWKECVLWKRVLSLNIRSITF